MSAPKFQETTVTCSICDTESTQLIAREKDFPEQGSPDLDTRPAGPRRETLVCWVQHCPKCLYCAPDLTVEHKNAKEVVRSAIYREINTDTHRPALVNRFLCSSILATKAGEKADAMWQSLYAAWACDDAQLYDEAFVCRERALKLLLIAPRNRNGDGPTESPEETTALLVDLLRRCKQFDAAAQTIELELAKTPVPLVECILKFERSLCAMNDDRPYTVQQAKTWFSTSN